MPEVCRFDGITIRLYYREHGPPHFHAIYGEAEAQINIDSLEVLHGNLPSRRLRDVIDWAGRRQAELQNAWDRAQAGELPGRVDPPE